MRKPERDGARQGRATFQQKSTHDRISPICYNHLMLTFTQKVFEVVRKIPKGSTLTYKQVAVKAGRPLAFRAVGNILNKNYNKDIPCHRVIRSNGKIGGYNRGSNKKVQILKKEFLSKI